MQQSMFNLRVPLGERGEVFLMNTLTDAQLIVSTDVAGLLDRLSDDPGSLAPERLDTDERDALVTLTEHGFIVPSRASDTEALNKFFTDYREDTEQMRVTVLTTLQCNFACDYCFQGDHGDYNKHADRMSLDDSARLSAWIEQRLDELKPKRLTVTFFGGEPLLNIPVVYDQAERAFAACQKRGVTLALGIITNGLLLTEELVDRLLPYGLAYVKVTLDGDRDTHNKMRPLRGGQGTFDRIIENVRKVAGKVRIAVGGNFDADSVESYPGAARLPQGAGLRGQAGQGCLQAGGPPEAGAEERHPAHGHHRQAAERHVHDRRRLRRIEHLRHVPVRRRATVAPARRDQEARVRHRGRRPHGAVRDPQEARLHDWPQRLDLRLPRVYRRADLGDRPHRRPLGELADVGGGAIRTPGGVAQVRRLRVYSGLRGRLFGRLTYGAWRHEHADMSQADFRIGAHIAGA